MHKFDSRIHLEKFFQISNDLLCITDNNGIFIKLNPEWKKKLGYTTSDLEGKSHLDFLHPDDVKNTNKAFCEIAKSKEAKAYTNRFRKRNGEYRCLQWRLFTDKDLIFASVQDITERRKAEDSLRLTQFSIDSSSVSFMWFDDHAKVVYANEAACNYLGYAAEELLNMRIFDFDPDFKEEEWEQHKKQLQVQKRMVFESRHLRKDGSIFPVEVTTNYINYNGKFFACTFDKDITEHKKYQEALLKNQKILNESQRIAQMGSWEINLKDNSTYWSDSIYEIYGIDKNTNKEEITQDFFLSLVHPDDHNSLQERIYGTLKKGYVYNDEYRIIRPDGKVRNMLASAEIISDSKNQPVSLIGVVQDITEQKKREKELIEAKEKAEESEQKIQRIYEFAPISIGLLDKRTILDVNSKVCSLTGYTKEELVGEKTRIVFPSDEEYEKVGQIMYSQLVNVGFGELESNWKRKDGKLINVYLALTYLNPDDPAKGVLFTALDVSKQKEAEMAVRASNDELKATSEVLIETNTELERALAEASKSKALEEANRELKDKENLLKEQQIKLEATNEELKATNQELNKNSNIIETQNKELKETLDDLKNAQAKLLHAEKMASLGVLTAGVAHEINNPLNFIYGAYEGLKNLAQKADVEPDTELLLDAIKTGIDRAVDIVRSLNQFSRETENNDEDCRIHEIIDNCLIMLQNRLKHRIKVKKDYTNNNLTIRGNVGNLHQVFTNLISNAEQAIDNRGTIFIKTTQKNNKAFIEIRDTGHGIEEKDLKHIAVPFFTTKSPGKGTGLGLSIAYNILKEHNGTIEFNSKVGEGTLVSIVLPLKH